MPHHKVEYSSVTEKNQVLTPANIYGMTDTRYKQHPTPLTREENPEKKIIGDREWGGGCWGYRGCLRDDKVLQRYRMVAVTRPCGCTNTSTLEF